MSSFQRVMQPILWALMTGGLMSSNEKNLDLVDGGSLLSVGIDILCEQTSVESAADELLKRFADQQGKDAEFVLAAIWCALTAKAPEQANKWLRIMLDHFAKNGNYMYRGFNETLMKSVVLGFHASLAWCKIHNHPDPFETSDDAGWDELVALPITLNQEEMKSTSPLQTALRNWIDKWVSGRETISLATMSGAFEGIAGATNNNSNTSLGNVVVRMWALSYMRALSTTELVILFNEGFEALKNESRLS